MNIRLICPGKIKEKWMQDGIAEYKKRISRFAKVDILELPDAPDSIPAEKALAQEGELILSKISPSDVLWVMDLHGKLLTSEELSEHLIADLEKGGSKLTVAIGGSNGISPELRSRANRLICLGNVTLTHQMTRLILLEQLYRGFKIAANEKYHK
ncbi:MAG: 23S rRNA (pseudouridine(1915)-N(3))-methyltransferase RlmH [Clostridiales bacterium]|nr:23S rRNA (pseudouridine(1915)-N(3))-methyltransferase RlmH [Clostridiales bacterium]